ncbi:MAG: hypothetical protein IPK29_17190 [Betaproteobacteria bacterium]|nr:hypothetical protein [Betaproteobacteria bacterium]
MNKTRSLLAAASAVMIFGAGNALAQGYWANPASGATWKNGFGQCWKTTYFTPAMASAECDRPGAPARGRKASSRRRNPSSPPP